MAQDLSDYYKQLDARKLESSAPDAPSTGMYKEKLEELDNPAKKIMFLGSEAQKLDAEMQSMDTLANRAKNGVKGAIDEIMNKFGHEEATVLRVTLDPSMVDDGKIVVNGRAHDKVGIKEINSDKDLHQLTQDVKVAQEYFPKSNIGLSEIDAADGKRLAVVTGIEAREFNAVMSFEKERKEVAQQQELLAQEKSNSFASMGMTAKVAVSGGETSKAAESFASTPAADKSKDLQLA